MYISRDKCGHFLLSESLPKRCLSHWSPRDYKYIVLNSKYGEELYGDIKWDDEPKEIEVNFRL